MMLDVANRPLVIGHRGARGLYPENTLDGFRRAIALGVDAIELDLAVSADGILVVSHDLRFEPDIARDPAGDWIKPPGPRIRDLSFDELRRYDVGRMRPGSAYAASFPHQKPVDGARVPSFSQILALDCKLPLLVELKTSPAERDLTVGPVELTGLAADAVIAARAGARSMILCFEWRALRHLRRHHPGIATGWLTARMDDAECRLWRGEDLVASFGRSAPQAIAAEGGSCWMPEFSQLSEPDLAAARRLGLPVVPWSVDRREDIARAIAWGVDGLITDRPDLALQARSAKQRSAASGVAQ